MISGRNFSPIGVNYFHLNRLGTYQTFDTFDPGQFDAREFDSVLGAISRDGFNYVRLFLTGYYPDRGFDGTPDAIADSYMSNLSKALSIADKHGLYVVLSGLFQKGTSIPTNYLPPNADSHGLGVDGPNRLLLLPGYVDGLAAFYRDLFKGLNGRNPGALSCVLYVDLYNEIKYDTGLPPFSQRSGTYLFRGRSFRLDVSDEREELANAATTHWFKTIKGAISNVAPKLLLTASIFPNSSFGRKYFNGVWSGSDPTRSARSPYPVNPESLRVAGADLLDIHLYVYPGGRAPVAMHDDLLRVLGSSGIGVDTGRSTPIVIGELGAMKAAYPSPEAAATEIRATTEALCHFHVAGWAFWMWDGQGSTWSLTEHENALAHTLAPVSARPNSTVCDASTRSTNP
jgi:hypothetical protein